MKRKSIKKERQLEEFQRLSLLISSKANSSFRIFRTLQTVIEKVQSGCDSFRTIDGSDSCVQDMFVQEDFVQNCDFFLWSEF